MWRAAVHEAAKETVKAEEIRQHACRTMGQRANFRRMSSGRLNHCPKRRESCFTRGSCAPTLSASCWRALDLPMLLHSSQLIALNINFLGTATFGISSVNTWRFDTSHSTFRCPTVCRKAFQEHGHPIAILS